MKRIARTVLLTAIALSIGLHWIVLQSVAWAGMFVDYSAEYSLVEAIDKTFDADNKCNLCRLVEEGTQSAAESDKMVKQTKLDVFTTTTTTGAYLTPALEFALLEFMAMAPVATGPPTPPPLRS